MRFLTTSIGWRSKEPDMVDVFELAVRLLRGEVVEVTDDGGRTWRATASPLSLLWYGEPNPVLEGVDALEVADALAARF